MVIDKRPCHSVGLSIAWWMVLLAVVHFATAAVNIARVAKYVPSRYAMDQPANAGKAGGAGRPGVERNFSLVFRHNVPYVAGIFALVTDANGQLVAFQQARVDFVLVATGADAGVSVDALATAINGSIVDSGSFTGTMVTADAGGVVNFTAVTMIACTSYRTLWAARVCPIAASSAKDVVNSLTCSEWLYVTAFPNPTEVRLRFENAGDQRNLTAPFAVAGAAVAPFRIRLVSSCETPITFPDTYGATAVISANGVGIVGAVQQRATSDTDSTLAVFANLRAVTLPGAARVSWNEVPPTSTVALNVSATFSLGGANTTALVRIAPGLTVPFDATLKTFLLLDLTVAPPAESRVAVQRFLIPLTWEQFTIAVDLDRAAHSTGSIGQTSAAIFAPDVLRSAALDDGFVVSMRRIRVERGAPFAFVYNASAFTRPDSLWSVPLPSTTDGWSRAANASLNCYGQYDMREVPRGMTYGLTQADFITSYLPFGAAFVDPLTGIKNELFLAPFLVGPLGELSSTTDEVLTCVQSEGMLARGYLPDPVSLKLSVIGLPDTKTGTARRFLSVFALLNPELAFISVVVQVCDCTLDHGLPMDLGLHPLQFPIGTDQLTRFPIGALVGNSLLIILSFAVPYVVSLRLRQLATTNPNPARAEKLTWWAEAIFPHLGLTAAITLYPGIAFSAYSVLPYIHNTFLVLVWGIIGVVWLIVFPGVILRLSVKISPKFFDLDVHSITSSCIFKVVVPLGDYESTHRDAFLYRATYHVFRGPYRWFLVVLLAEQVLVSIFAAHFVDCRWRFLLPLAMQVVFFFFVVSRAPFITAYRNVVAAVSALVMIIGLSMLFWDGSERHSTLVISSWAMTLAGVSIAVTVLDAVYAAYQSRYVLGAARGHLDEDFVEVVEDDAHRRRRMGTTDMTGTLHYNEDTEGFEFVRHEIEDDGLTTKNVKIDNDDAEHNPFVNASAVPNPVQAKEIKRLEHVKQVALSAVVPRHRAVTVVHANAPGADDNAAAAVPVVEGAPDYEAWASRLSPREAYEAAEDAARMKRERLTGEQVEVPLEDKRHRPRDTLNNPKAAAQAAADRAALELFRTAKVREAQRVAAVEAEIEAHFWRRSKPTAEPTLKYGDHFAPSKRFGHHRRAEEAARRFAVNPKEAAKLLMLPAPLHEDDEDAWFNSIRKPKAEEEARAVAEAMRTPRLPTRRLNPAFEAICQQRAAAREEAQARRAALSPSLARPVPPRGGVAAMLDADAL